MPKLRSGSERLSLRSDGGFENLKRRERVALKVYGSERLSKTKVLNAYERK